MNISEIKHHAQWIATKSNSSNKEESLLAKNCIKELNQKERNYLLEVLNGTEQTTDQSINKTDFEAKLKAIYTLKSTFTRRTSFLKKCRRIWDNLFHGRISSSKVLNAINQQKPDSGAKTVLTGFNRSEFSDFISRSEKRGEYVIQHASTYPGSALTDIPTDHAGVRSIKNGYHIVVADGMSHHDAAGIGQVAAEVVDITLTETLSNRLNLDPSLSPKDNYINFLKPINKSYQMKEGTCLLEAEILKNPDGGIDVTLCQCGDSAFIVVNEQGKVVYSTKDYKKEKISQDSDKEKGLIGLGAGFSSNWLRHTVIDQVHFDEKVFLIACSDGLSDHFNLEDGSLNTTAFEKSIQTGKFNEEPDPTNPLTIDCFRLSESLRNAAFDASLTTGKNGDDTTIVVLTLN